VTGDNAFGLGADVDQDGIAIDAHYHAFDNVSAVETPKVVGLMLQQLRHVLGGVVAKVVRPALLWLSH
jgi:hypothetical protein